MNYDELIDQLVAKTALIVHCSRAGQGDKKIGEDIYPEDLKKAIQVAQSDGGLSCSVIWPQHRHTYGELGLILRPRSTASVMEISVIDAGSSINPHTGKREGSGNPFSNSEVSRTFNEAKEYNEWIIAESDVVGVFVQPRTSWQVSALCEFDEEFVLSTGVGKEYIGQKTIGLRQIASDFDPLPVYTLNEAVLIKHYVTDDEISWKALDISEIYHASNST